MKTNDSQKKIKHVVDRLADYCVSDEAESMLLLEIAKDNKAAWAWIILAIIKLEEKEFRCFGACLRCLKNALEDESIDDMLTEITKTVEQLKPYLEKFDEISDFLEGYTADRST